MHVLGHHLELGRWKSIKSATFLLCFHVRGRLKVIELPPTTLYFGVGVKMSKLLEISFKSFIRTISPKFV